MFKADTVIGIEIHVELKTKSKLFCGCATSGDDQPNTRTCVTCLGHPGSKPVLNKKAVESALKLCLALNCKIANELVFSRKSYFYPDLAKNYQITQYEMPLGKNGKLALSSGKKVGITRVHIEEDPASLIHPGGMQKSNYVMVDYNRSGNPLVEIVTEPELASPEEARDFMKHLVTVLNYLKIFDQNNGIIKADANVSIKSGGYTRVEIKNITGFKEIERALMYEVERQKKCVGENKKIVQETRGWDADKGITFSLRKKEKEEDYGYITEPNLVPVDIDGKMLADIKKHMPELAQDKMMRLIAEYKIHKEDAKIICSDLELGELFENVAKKIEPVLAARWFRKELLRVLNYHKIEVSEMRLGEKHIIDLLKLVESRKISDRIAQQLLEKMVEEPFIASEYVEKEKLHAVYDMGELDKFCQEAIEKSPKAVEEYKSGKEIAINFLVGYVMRATKGKADAKTVKEMIKGMI